MKITLKFLEDIDACSNGIEFFKENYQDSIEDKELILSLLDKGKEEYANWLIVRLFNKEQCVKYAIFAAELVLHIFEDKYPDDKRPRLAIESAKNYLVNPCDRNRIAAADAAFHAVDAAHAAADVAAYHVAYATAHVTHAAHAAADVAAYHVAYAAHATTHAAHAASSASSASTAYAAAKNVIYKNIINYGLQLLEENK